MKTKKQLKHRLRMVEDDIKVIRDFLNSLEIPELSNKPTEMADNVFIHISNIDIACDLNSDECLKWNLFNKQ